MGQMAMVGRNTLLEMLARADDDDAVRFETHSNVDIHGSSKCGLCRIVLLVLIKAG